MQINLENANFRLMHTKFRSHVCYLFCGAFVRINENTLFLVIYASRIARKILPNSILKLFIIQVNEHPLTFQCISSTWVHPLVLMVGLCCSYF
jgi:hypothetical protein